LRVTREVAGVEAARVIFLFNAMPRRVVPGSRPIPLLLGWLLAACSTGAAQTSARPALPASRPVTLVEAAIDPNSPPAASVAPPTPVAPAAAEPASGPGWLGVALTARPAAAAGAVVSNVLRRSPAALSGIEVGDVVLAVNGQSVLDPAQLSHAVAEAGAGGRVNLLVQRAGEQRLFAVALGRNPGLEGQLRLGFVDAPAPEFAGVEVAQGDAAPTLQALRGRVVVLEFWATWCGACRALLPTLNDWHERFPAQQAQVVSVTVDPALKAARDAAQLGMRYPVLSDPEGQTAQLYQAFALPTLFVIDRAGVVRDVSVGFDPKRLRALEATVQRLISEPG
jgi:thiol-disulfide isomerase/thioredoxin